jgi:hypothetical protein
MSVRYKGKPLLRLMELYVLSVIGETSTDEEITLEKMTPRLQQLYGTSGSWQDAIVAAVGFPASFPDDVRGRWEDNKFSGQTQPQQFAEMIVDQYMSS